MTKTEVRELVDLIVIHRPYFKSRLGDKVYQDLLNEWTRIMNPYDSEDIKENLEKFLKDENNYGREPDAYQLIRGIYTTEEKQEGLKGRVQCMFCNKSFSRLDIHEHEDRCRSIKYLDRQYKKLLNRQLVDKSRLYDMPEEEFNSKYINTLEKLLPYMKNSIDIRGTTNVIETYYGREPKYTINEVIGGSDR